MPAVTQKIFPAVQITVFNSKEGLKQLQEQLANRQDYKSFLETEWANYLSLKTVKQLQKQDLVDLIQQENIGRDAIRKFTSEKKIIRLGKKGQN